MPLWNALMEAGRDLDVRAGCPNAIERIEGGLLSYGNDMTRENTPHECGLGRFCNTATAIGCVGRDALLRVAKEGPVKQIRAIEIETKALPPCDRAWPLMAGKKQVGVVTSAAQSPDFGCGVGIGMVRMTHWDDGTELRVETQDGVFPRRCMKSSGIRNRMLRRDPSRHRETGETGMTFRALVVEEEEQGQKSASVQMLEDDRLPEGDVTVAVEYSTLNYKDGLCLGSGGGLVRNYPHVPGIDFAGTVEASDDDRYKPGDKVVLTGWRVGEVHWGGYAEKARVKADWLVPLPEGLDTRMAMAVGTAGFTAMLAIMALEDHGLTPGKARFW
jgi:hypothetical protein